MERFSGSSKRIINLISPLRFRPRMWFLYTLDAKIPMLCNQIRALAAPLGVGATNSSAAPPNDPIFSSSHILASIGTIQKLPYP
ncbi:hypothetical protein ACFL60_01990 [Candidatus Omnitrophota bacterium]